eukprot:1149909-Pelagomonas_calceolata.AAC.5
MKSYFEILSPAPAEAFCRGEQHALFKCKYPQVCILGQKYAVSFTGPLLCFQYSSSLVAPNLSPNRYVQSFAIMSCTSHNILSFFLSYSRSSFWMTG